MVLANYHQGDKQFGDYRGIQCTAMVIYSMCYSLSFNIIEWNSNDLDTILFEGCDFYKELIIKYQIPRRYLGVDDVLGEHSLFGINYIVDKFVMFNNQIQLLDNDNDDLHLDFVYNGEFSYNDFLLQIQMFYSSQCLFALFICNASSYGFIKQQNRVYLFDSHAKLANGERSEQGKSSLRTFITLNELTNYMVKINQIGAYFQMIYLNIYVKTNNSIVQTNQKLVKSFSSMSIDEENTSLSMLQ